MDIARIDPNLFMGQIAPYSFDLNYSSLAHSIILVLPADRQGPSVRALQTVPKQAGFWRWRVRVASAGRGLRSSGLTGAVADIHSTLTAPIAPRPNCHGLYMSST